jgi:hypothetical protein
MCYYDDGDRAEVWHVSQVRARKVHHCVLCNLPIVVGLRHTAISSLYDERWEHIRVHDDCHALSERIQLDVCGQDVVFLEPGALRGEVREHMREEPGVLREYREVLRARRAEGVWPARREVARAG